MAQTNRSDMRKARMEDEPGLRQALRENGYMARRRARGIRRGRGAMDGGGTEVMSKAKAPV